LIQKTSAGAELRYYFAGNGIVAQVNIAGRVNFNAIRYGPLSKPAQLGRCGADIKTAEEDIQKEDSKGKCKIEMLARINVNGSFHNGTNFCGSILIFSFLSVGSRKKVPGIMKKFQKL
jgi:hypothetical protein